MKHAFIFPGQGAQFSGMGKTLCDNHESVRALFEQANEILGFRISDTMFTGTDEAKVEEVCKSVSDETGEVVVAANYNCPGQLVISGSLKGIEVACERMKAAGAKRALILPVGGAFHSPLMLPAKEELAAAINK